MRWIRSSIAVALLGAASLVLPADARTEGRDPSEPVGHRVTSDAKAVRDYWTRERMQAATPVPLLEPDAQQQGSAFEEPAGEPGYTEPSEPTAARTSSKRVTRFRGSASGPIPYTRTEIVDPSAQPYVTNGALFGVGGNGEPYSCSATAVSSQNRSVAWTAGHCVFLREAGGWFHSLAFVPGYRDGVRPYGEWPVLEAWSPAGWTDFQSPSFDMAALVLAANPDGTRLEDVIGGRGLAWNLSRRLQFDSFGYPATPPFTGERLWLCESRYGLDDPLGLTAKPRPTAIGCDMEEGSSGGGWIVRDMYLNGVNSYGFEQIPEVMFGPYFGNVVPGLYNSASTSIAPGPLPAAVPLPPLVGAIHPMKLELKLTGHLVAKGTMRAPDAYTACTRSAPVVIAHRDRGGWDVAKRTRTRSNGSFSVKLKDLPGRYLAYAPEGSVDDLNVCAEARSRRLRHV